MVKKRLMMKKIPYGVSNFKQLIENDYLYVDKTHFIQTLENQADYAIFQRPRRFGKSLFVSTMCYYYDEYYQDVWDDLFGQLYIGKHPTPLKSSYKVLFLDFSGIVSDSFESIYRGFTSGLKFSLESFLTQYQYPTSDIKQLLTFNSPEELMKGFFVMTQNARIYLMIDEYDHFANAILASDFKLFKDIVGKGGFVRSFYEIIKTATQRGIVARLFITGVTPITLDSLTSGFNIGKNISHFKAFNELAGFTLEESKVVLKSIFDVCTKLSQEKLIQDITHFYNGYQFSPIADNKIFNANMLMYFVDTFDKNNCAYPMKMLDSNIASDYGKIMQLFSIGKKDDNDQILNELIYQGQAIATLKDKFDFGANAGDGFDRDEFISLLFAMGFVTIKAVQLNEIIFTIPNYVIKHLYFNYFKKEIESRHQLTFRDRDLKTAMSELALTGNVSTFEQEVKKVIDILSNRDRQNFSEKHLKILLLTILNISDFYFIKSEMEVNKKYPDIMLLERSPFDVKFQYLFELKYSKKKDNNWEQKKQEGISQIQGYQQLEEITQLKNLKCYLIISNGDELKMHLVE